MFSTEVTSFSVNLSLQQNRIMRISKLSIFTWPWAFAPEYGLDKWTQEIIINYGLLWCDAVRFDRWVTTFQSNMPPSSSLFYPEVGSRKFLRNTGIFLQNYTVSHLRILTLAAFITSNIKWYLLLLSATHSLSRIISFWGLFYHRHTFHEVNILRQFNFRSLGKLNKYHEA